MVWVTYLKTVVLVLVSLLVVTGCAGIDLASVLYTVKEDMLLALRCPELTGSPPLTPPMFSIEKDVTVKLTAQVTTEGKVEVAPYSFWSALGARISGVKTQEITITLSPLLVTPGDITINPGIAGKEVENVKAVGLLSPPTGSKDLGDYVVYLAGSGEQTTETWTKRTSIEKIEVKRPGAFSAEARSYLTQKCQEKFGFRK